MAVSGVGCEKPLIGAGLAIISLELTTSGPRKQLYTCTFPMRFVIGFSGRVGQHCLSNLIKCSMIGCGWSHKCMADCCPVCSLDNENT